MDRCVDGFMDGLMDVWMDERMWMFICQLKSSIKSLFLKTVWRCHSFHFGWHTPSKGHIQWGLLNLGRVRVATASRAVKGQGNWNGKGVKAPNDWHQPNSATWKQNVPNLFNTQFRQRHFRSKGSVNSSLYCWLDKSSWGKRSPFFSIHPVCETVFWRCFQNHRDCVPPALFICWIEPKSLPTIKSFHLSQKPENLSANWTGSGKGKSSSLCFRHAILAFKNSARRKGGGWTQKSRSCKSQNFNGCRACPFAFLTRTDSEESSFLSMYFTVISFKFWLT